MPPALHELIDPAHTALVTSECQNGVLGKEAIFPALAEAARPEVVNNIRLLVGLAHHRKVQVIHCLALRREDDRGANTNARLFQAAAKADVALTPGSSAAELIDDIPVEFEDLFLTRLHGLSPMAGTDLDPVLRNLGVKTIVVAGASVNVAVTNLVMDAVNAGYQVVLPRDAVVGTPPDYAAAVIDNTLALLATVTTIEEVVTTWASGF